MNDSITHHGIKGQKHGVQNGPPYPLGSDQKSAAEKKHKSVRELLTIEGQHWNPPRDEDGNLTITGKRLERKLARKAAKAEAKKERAAQEAAKAEAKKQQDARETMERKNRAITSGDAHRVYSERRNMTNQELRQAIERIELERKLTSLTTPEKKSGWNKVQDISSKINTASKLVSSVSGMYSSFNSLHTNRDKYREYKDKQKQKER